MKLRTTEEERRGMWRSADWLRPESGRASLAVAVLADLEDALAEIARLEQRVEGHEFVSSQSFLEHHEATDKAHHSLEQRYQHLLKLVKELPILVNWDDDSRIPVSGRKLRHLAEFVREG